MTNDDEALEQQLAMLESFCFQLALLSGDLPQAYEIAQWSQRRKFIRNFLKGEIMQNFLKGD